MRIAFILMVAGALIACGEDSGGSGGDAPQLTPMTGTPGAGASADPVQPPGAASGNAADPAGGAGTTAPPPSSSDQPPAEDDASDPQDDGSGATDPATPTTPPRDYFPTDGWQTKEPGELGFDAGALDAAFEYVQESNTEALLVVRGGYIAREEYYGSFDAEERHQSYSMAKSFTSALVGIAIERGLLPGVDATFCSYYDAWDCADAADTRSRITLAHAMTLTSGLDWQEDWSAGLGTPNDAISMSSSARPINYVLAKDGAHEPGTHFQYSTGDPALLSGVLEQATGKTALEFAREVLLDPIGIGGIVWGDDADGHTTTYAGLSATAREYAKFGFLYLNRGLWDGAQIVPADWVQVSTNPGLGLSEWYGYLWHVNAPVKWEDPTLPADGFAAIGVQGQHIIVLPTQDVVIVRLASDGFGPSPSFGAGTLINHVLAALP